MSIIKKERIGVLSIIVVVLLITLSCTSAVKSSSKMPAWIDSLYDKNYSEKNYICAVGAGSTRENAVNAAFSSLSQAFHTQVESSLSYYGISSADSTGVDDAVYSDSESMIDQSQLSSKTERIVGGEVVNSYVAEDNTVWVRVAVNRKKTAEVYNKDMKILESEVARIRKQAKEATTPLSHFFRLLVALPSAMEHQQLAEQVRLLTGETNMPLLYNLEHELDVLAGAISVALDINVSVPEAEIDTTEIQLKSAFMALFSDFGFNMVEQTTLKHPVVVIDYSVVDAELTGGRYAHVRYALSVQVKEGSAIVATYQKNQRETALTAKEARQRALRLALNDAVHGISAALAGK